MEMLITFVFIGVCTFVTYRCGYEHGFHHAKKESKRMEKKE